LNAALASLLDDKDELMHDECQQLQGLLSLLWGINRMGLMGERVAHERFRGAFHHKQTSRIVPKCPPVSQPLWEWFMPADLPSRVHPRFRQNGFPCASLCLVALYMHF
jgi:hypothetical protein